ncbi:hypothetical protein BYT27DRAFT_7185239 [Phlegmacium glaucopus]|nr:hypothetical protein BYT27DRAFT_7185239 [Phlegmacium glaucopus]
MSSISRRLSLHASALSDDEYQFYTTSLLSIVSVEDESQSHNIVDDAYFEKMNVNVRETRAWMRGRYSHISSLIIDKILKLFSPNLSSTDSLSGGEFFAVLRLVVHAENGKEVDRSLAFVQAQVGRSLNSVPRRSYTDPSLASSSVIESSVSHNPFTSTAHPQPPLHPSQRSESSSTTSHNPFIQRTLPTRSEDGNAKLPPLPPRKPPVPQPPSMIAAPPKHLTSSHNRLDRSRSPSKPASTTIPPPLPSHTLPPTIPPKPIHHITSTLIKQSLQATKAAQTMKKAEEQLERERVMQVLKSSSTVSGTNVYNQHQYQQQQQQQSNPVMGQGGSGSGLNRKYGYAVSSTSSSSDERAPPLPKRRTQQQQPSPPLSTSSLEQVALAGTHHHPHSTSAPPSTTASAFSNPEGSSNAHVHAYPKTASPFHSRSRVPVDSANAIPYTSSPEQSPKRTSLDLPSGGTTRGRPPPTHPDRKPHHLQHQYQPHPNSHTRSHSYSYFDPFAGTTNLDFKDEPPEEHATNVDESFESIYGPSSINNPSPFTNPFPPSPTTSDITPTTPSPPNRVLRSNSLHHQSPIPPVSHSSLGRKRPESVQVFRPNDIEVEVDRDELTVPPSSPNRNSKTKGSGSVSRHTSLMMPTLSANSNSNRRSSLSISSTPSSSSSSVNHLGNWQPTTPHRQTPSSSSSSLTVAGPPPHPRPPSSTSSTTTTKHDHSTPISNTPNPLTSLQKTFLQIQPHLDKARYKAEAGLSKRGFVRDGLRTRSKNSGSGGADGDGGEDADGSEDGLEGLMGGGGNDGGGGKTQVRRWRVHHDGSGGGGVRGGSLDRAYDGDSDWTRSEGMSMSLTARGRSDGDEDDLGRDNLKWPVGEGWKPL